MGMSGSASALPVAPLCSANSTFLRSSSRTFVAHCARATMRLGNVYYGTVHLSRLARPCRRGPSPVYAASLGRKTGVRGVRGRGGVRCTPLFTLLAQACHTRTRETGLVWEIRRLRGRAANKRPTADFEPGAFCCARRKAERRTWGEILTYALSRCRSLLRLCRIPSPAFCRVDLTSFGSLSSGPEGV